MTDQDEPTQPTRPTRLELTLLFGVALAAASTVGTHGLAYWDAGDYVRQALRGEPSGLLLGRPLFLAVSRWIVDVALRLGAGEAALEPCLRWWWTAFSSLAPSLFALLVARLGLGRRAALAAGAALAISPSFAHTAHQVLTDAPALTLVFGALVLACPTGGGDDRRSSIQAFFAGVLVAAAVAVRETAALQFVAVVLLLWPKKRAASVATLSFVVGLSLVVLHAKGSATLAGWFDAMASSSSKHPIGLRDVGLSIVWMLTLGPLPVVLAVIAMRPRELRTVLAQPKIRAVVLPSLLGTLLLTVYPDGSFSPRYLLSTAPLALLVVAAKPLANKLGGPRRVRFALLLVAPLALAPVALARTHALAREGEEMRSRLRIAPDHALVVPGHLCPAAGAVLAEADAASVHRAGIGVPRARLELLCPGWAWPANEGALTARLDDARCHGRAVLLDTRDEAWVGAREWEAKSWVRAYVAREANARILADFTVLEPLLPGASHCLLSSAISN